MKLSEREKKENSSIERNNKTNKKIQMEAPPTETVKNSLHLHGQKLDNLTQRLNKLEQLIHEMITPQNDHHTHTLPIGRKKRVEDEPRLSEKLAAHIQKEEKIHEKIIIVGKSNFETNGT